MIVQSRSERQRPTYCLVWPLTCCVRPSKSSCYKPCPGFLFREFWFSQLMSGLLKSLDATDCFVWANAAWIRIKSSGFSSKHVVMVLHTQITDRFIQKPDETCGYLRKLKSCCKSTAATHPPLSSLLFLHVAWSLRMFYHCYLMFFQ